VRMMTQSLSAITLLSVLVLQSSTAIPSNDVVTAVSRNVQEFRDLLPDFVCTERITSAASEAGKVRSQKTVDSIFSIQKWREHREVTAIDGKPAKKNGKLPRLPANITGVFGYSAGLNAEINSTRTR
jgi:hypothetical protein